MKARRELESAYESRRALREEELAALEGKHRRIAALRLGLAVSALGFVVTALWAPLTEDQRAAPWVALGAATVGFFLLASFHGRVLQARDRAQARVRFHVRALARLRGAWRAFAQDGRDFRTPEHPYGDDLDLFGPGSLFQWLDGTETRFGEEALAGLLDGSRVGSFPDAVRARQDGVRELADALDLREELSASGHLALERRFEPRPFLAWAEAASTFRPSVAETVGLWLLPIFACALFALAPSFGVPRSTGFAVVLLEVLWLRAMHTRIAPTVTAALSHEGAFARSRDMLRLLESQSFQSDHLRSLQSRLRGDGGAASAIDALNRIVSFLEARHNEVFRLFIGPVLLWDAHCAARLERWRERFGTHARAWFEAVGEVEALASLASVCVANETSFPEFVSEPCFEATGLAHPLLPPAQRRANDVAIAGAGRALLVTGSNMAGKSTLLRALGANCVLALAGGPVAAAALRLGPCKLVTSMRIADSLEAGVSHFYAEVRRMKRALDESQTPPPVFFLFDEILHGTNSRERIIGSRSVIDMLLGAGAFGAVSTHDLGLADIESRSGGRVLNVHFQEQVEGDKMSFDYVLRPGVVQSSNALRLMRMVGIPVPLDGDSVPVERDGTMQRTEPDRS